MSEAVRQLEPTAIWTNFADLNAVPRASKKEERVIDFITSFGKNLGLQTEVDAVGNVIIRKPATPGMENRMTVVLQSHLDMVHQKNNDTEFDFDTEGIRMLVENDWVKADGTTLGADNGLGVASIMAILQSKDIKHPPIEALFTIDEETGMTGAKGLQPGVLTGDILLNLDTEEDDEIGVGCAGGVDVTAKRNYIQEDCPEAASGFKLTVKGLNGGHSGMDIHKGLGNANKIMNRLLYAIPETMGLRISSLDGGGLRNAIPRESRCVLVVDSGYKTEFEKLTHDMAMEIKKELQTMEPGLEIILNPVETPTKVMEKGIQKLILRAVYACLNGVYRMSADIPDLVETSNNLARVLIENGEISIKCLTRSSVESSKNDLANALKATFELAGCEVGFSGDYPGWTPDMNSKILNIMVPLYKELFNGEPNVAACHAGLECGILGTHYPEMEMISFGPNIRGAHSPDERAQVSSVQKFWEYLKAILENIPSK